MVNKTGTALKMGFSQFCSERTRSAMQLGIDGSISRQLDKSFNQPEGENLH